MNVVSLFSGVGGIDLGLERAGMRVVLQCEKDAAARRVLARHWPGVPCFGDVHDVGADWRQRVESERGRGPVRVVAGGFPCQDLSVAGSQAGLAGERSGLFFEAARVADALLGDGGWLLIENVPGLFSSNGGRDFAIVLATLAELGFHDLAWRVLDSRYFGVPQRRRRVFILARRAAGDGARTILLEPESGGGNHQAGARSRQDVAASLSRGSSRPGVSAPGRRQEDDSNIVGTLLGGGHRLGADEVGAGHVVGALAARDFRSNGHNNSNPGTHADSLVASAGPDREGEAPGLPGWLDDPLRPLTCPAEPRPDGPRAAQMGNAVTVGVAEWIGQRLLAYDESLNPVRF